MSKKARQGLLNRMVAWAPRQEEMVALYLFGSEAAGNALPISDLDVAVLARADLPKERLWRLEDRWSAEWIAVSGPAVDLMVLNLAPIPIRFEVITHGRLLWTADVSRVAEFESLALRRYWDLKPILDAYWKAGVEQLMEAENEAERRQHEAALEHVRAVHRRVREASGRYSG